MSLPFPPILSISAGSATRTLCPTLPLSGRQEAFDCGADGSWWPVHSRGLLDGFLRLNMPFACQYSYNTVERWVDMGFIDALYI